MAHLDSGIVLTLKRNHPSSREKTCAQSLSHVWLFAISWTGARLAPLSMGLSRQEYWSGLPFPSPKEKERERDEEMLGRSGVWSEFSGTETWVLMKDRGHVCSVQQGSGPRSQARMRGEVRKRGFYRKEVGDRLQSPWIRLDSRLKSLNVFSNQWSPWRCSPEIMRYQKAFKKY